MTIVEAFSVGTPVICSDLGNAGNLVEEGITGVKFRPESAEGLVQAVKQIREYKNIYSTTFRQYENCYTESINYKDLLKVYMAIKR